MPSIVDTAGKLYQPFGYELEADLEADVTALADRIFGSSTIYVDAKKRMKGNDIISIPDGYVVDMTEVDDPKLFVIENEIAKHDPLKHIGIQLLRFATSFEDAQLQVRRILMEEIAKQPESLKRLEDNCQGSSVRNIDAYLDKAVYGPFRALVIIDEARPELHHVLGKVNANISVLELHRYRAEDGSILHHFDTLYEEDAETIAIPVTKEPSSRESKRERLAAADTIIVPARPEGFARVFLGEDRWYQVKISAAMKERIKYIAAYQVAPISAVTHIADVQAIKPFEDSGKYQLVFKGSAREIEPVPVSDLKNSPQGPVYVQLSKLEKAGSLEEVLR